VARHFEVVVCEGPTCASRPEGQALRARLLAALHAQPLGAEIEVQGEICFGHCTQGPVVVIRPGAADGTLPEPGLPGEQGTAVLCSASDGAVLRWLRADETP
jgi:NADH:ubiquinone oxidoreductase subunit E